MRPPEYNYIQDGPDNFSLVVVQLFDKLFPVTSFQLTWFSARR
jgi:hypothetical protein